MTTMFDRLRARAAEKCIPLTVTLELTLRCNLRCVHCYNFDRDLPYLPLKKREDELSDGEIHRILDEVREEGCLYLALSGGESLVHPSLAAFVEHGARAGMMVTVKSNGTLFDQPAARKLADAGAAAAEISLYGACKETHDPFVKVDGAFERTLAGAQAARHAGMRVKLSFVIVQRNAAEVPAMMQMAQERGFTYGIDPQLTARYDGSTGPLDLRVDRPTLESLYRGPLSHLVPPTVENPSSVQCACARTVCGISAFGEVYPCIGAPVPSGNLRRATFHQIWTESPQLNRIRGLRLDDFAACKSCEHMPHCRRSSGVIYTNTGEYTGPPSFGDDWTCMEAEVIHAIHDDPTVEKSLPLSAGALRRHSID
jgi:AdoMet-dependent heme synthase